MVTLKPSRQLPNFLPGQFLHLALDPYDPTSGYWPDSRVFSIASTPTDPEITIAYAVKGAYTKRMYDELVVNKEVWIKLPYGHFSMSAETNEEIFLVAGGTGIAPFVAFLLSEINRPTGVKLALFYGVRNSKLFLFQDIIDQAIFRLPGFQLFSFCEQDSITAATNSMNSSNSPIPPFLKVIPLNPPLTKGEEGGFNLFTLLESPAACLPSG